MSRTSLFVLLATLLLHSPAHAEDFNLVAYTGHYSAAYPQGTIEVLHPIPVGPDGWPRISRRSVDDLCAAAQYELFLFISTDFESWGVGGIDFTNPETIDVHGEPLPSGIYSGDWDAPDPYVTINNRAYWQIAPPPGVWVPVHRQSEADPMDGWWGYAAAPDTWYFSPFTTLMYAPLYEDPSPPPGSEYAGEFFKAAALQYIIPGGYFYPDLGGGGVLVPYMHLTVNLAAMPCGHVAHVSLAGLGLTTAASPDSYYWLGAHYPSVPTPAVPYGQIEFTCRQCCPCVGDSSDPCDDFVNATDFTIFASAYGTQAGDADYDVCADLAPAGSPDGIINVADFTIFAGLYQQPCP
jgi:hypothetical protein